MLRVQRIAEAVKGAPEPCFEKRPGARRRTQWHESSIASRDRGSCSYAPTGVCYCRVVFFVTSDVRFDTRALFVVRAGAAALRYRSQLACGTPWRPDPASQRLGAHFQCRSPDLDALVGAEEFVALLHVEGCVVLG